MHCLLSAMQWKVISMLKSSLDYAQKGLARHWQGKGPYDFKDFFFLPYLQYLKSIGIPSVLNSAEFQPVRFSRSVKLIFSPRAGLQGKNKVLCGRITVLSKNNILHINLTPISGCELQVLCSIGRTYFNNKIRNSSLLLKT